MPCTPVMLLAHSQAKVGKQTVVTLHVEPQGLPATLASHAALYCVPYGQQKPAGIDILLPRLTTDARRPRDSISGAGACRATSLTSCTSVARARSCHGHGGPGSGTVMELGRYSGPFCTRNGEFSGPNGPHHKPPLRGGMLRMSWRYAPWNTRLVRF